ncbi:MAG: type III pantothenate kinase [Verrucomicrobiae bacterium]|nr:type III pantothenate kinase [Verrucomicrobiae bacterium]
MDPFFVIDVGNTRAKWAISNRKRILKEHEFPTAKFTEIRGRKIPKLDLPDHPRGAIVSCVAPAALPGIRACLRSLGIARPLLVSAKLDLGIGVKVAAPEKVGADRLANTVAVAHLYGAPAVVVDFGTAVTFDVLSARKEYLGGAIAPGVCAMTDCLHERAALLPRITLAEPRSPIGNDTLSAMRVGAVLGTRGLIRGILEAISKKLKKPLGRGGLRVVATGGDATLIARGLREITEIAPRLTLDGLRLLYARNAMGDDRIR